MTLGHFVYLLFARTILVSVVVSHVVGVMSVEKLLTCDPFAVFYRHTC